MRVHVITAKELTDDLRLLWSGIQRSRQTLSSPYFCPGFVEAAAESRDNVRIGVIDDGGRCIGFFPFETERFGVAGPVGGRLSDFQGVIAGPGARWPAAAIVAACGLRMWRFDHLLCEHSEFAAFFEVRATSPAIELSRGFEAYCHERRSAGSKHVERTLAKARKMQRQQGEVAFEFDSRDAQALERVIAWKRQQCRRTGVADFLAVPANLALLHRIFETRTAGFAGVLSTLHVGGRLAAAHFGMRSHSTLHVWFPAYDAQFSRYSPGAVLLVEMARSAAAAGLTLLDLGKGDEHYKSSFCTRETLVAEGAVVVSPLLGALRRWSGAGLRFLRTAPAAAPVRAPVRALRRQLRRVMAGRQR
jgi:CelD/BcsL family acetyltransferase involved in cellulose biosynthesis